MIGFPVVFVSFINISFIVVNINIIIVIVIVIIIITSVQIVCLMFVSCIILFTLTVWSLGVRYKLMRVTVRHLLKVMFWVN